MKKPCYVLNYITVYLLSSSVSLIVIKASTGGARLDPMAELRYTANVSLPSTCGLAVSSMMVILHTCLVTKIGV